MALPYQLMEPAEELATEGMEKTGFVVPAGWYGIVRASSLGIIGRSRLDYEEPLPELMQELRTLAQPDPWSRNEDFEGRRMVRVSGGFLILNYAKYRELDRTGAERQKRYRERNVTRNADREKRNVTNNKRHGVTQAEAEAEAEAVNSSQAQSSQQKKLTSFAKKKKDRSRPRPENKNELVAYVTEHLKLPREDALALWEHWVGNGFTNNNRVMKDWRAVASNWERRGIFFPSKKAQTLPGFSNR